MRPFLFGDNMKKDNFLNSLKNSTLIPTKCKQSKCPVHNFCPKIPSEVVGNKKKVNYLFVDYSPEINDIECTRPFSGRVGMTLRNMIHLASEQLNIKPNYALTYVTKCVLSKELRKEYKRDAEISHCTTHLEKMVKKFNPKVIVLSGAKAIYSVLELNGSLDELHGTYKEVEFAGKKRKFYLTYSTGLGLMKPDSLGGIFEDIAILLGRKKPKIDITYGDADSDVNYKICKTRKQAINVIKKFAKSYKPATYDLETDNLSKFHNKILTMQLYNGGKFGYCIPWEHRESPLSKKDLEALIPHLKHLFSNKSKVPYFIGHYLKFDNMVTLNELGIRIEKALCDTLSGAFLLDETHTQDGDSTDSSSNKGGYGLGSQIMRYGYEEAWYFQAKSNRDNLNNEPLEYVAKYGVGDVVLNHHLLLCQIEEAKQQDYIKQFKTMLFEFYDRETKLFTDMENNGILVDVEYLRLLMDKQKSPLLKFLKVLYKEFGKCEHVIETNRRLSEGQKSVFDDISIFDANKTEHLHFLFFDVMGLEPINYGKPSKKFPKGAPSVGKKFKSTYSEFHPEVRIFNLITKTKQVYKLYAKKFYEILMTNPDCSDGRIRPSFGGTGTRTGRISTKDPNTQQNIRGGKDTKLEDRLANIIRGLYTTPVGTCFVKLDLMANEVREWGELSKDPNLCTSIKHGTKLRDKYYLNPSKKLLKLIKTEGDMHNMNAAKFYGIDISEVIKDEDMRQDSKGITFGNIYGLTVENLAKVINKTVEETEKIVKSFFETFKKGKKWLDLQGRLAKKHLFVETPNGRRRRLWYFLIQFALSKKSTLKKPKLEKKDGFVRSRHGAGERRACNSPVQGWGSDLGIIGTILINSYIILHSKPWKITNIVHDSTEAEIPVTDVVEYVTVAKVCYERLIKRFVKQKFRYNMTVPIEVDFEMGFTFRKLVKWDGSFIHLKKIQAKLIKATKNRKEPKRVKDINFSEVVHGKI